MSYCTLRANGSRTNAERLRHEPVAPKLERLGERARSLAQRLGKEGLRVEVMADGVLATSGVEWLWNVLPHVIANSVDHGLDTQEERSAAGKAEPAKLRLKAAAEGEQLVVEIEDNGRGIDWEKVRDKARRLGIKADTEQELIAALFSDGVSTREEATEAFGRGVGLAAVREACSEHGARIEVSSRPARGTLFRFVVANSNADDVGFTDTPTQKSAKLA
jgi:two-component system chemotaxis sensor kinase CheA